MGSHGGVYNYLDGIQVRITEKYRPLKRVILPPEYVNRLQQDIEALLDLDYDFKLEEQVLATFPNPEEQRPVENSSKSNSTSVETTKDTTEVIPPSNQHKDVGVSSSSPAEVRKKPARPPPPQPSHAQVAMNPFLNSVSYRPLEPQKAQNPSPVPTSTSSTSAFHIDEFEPTAANPFDNLDLKTINDMEELTQVLGGSSRPN